METNLKSKSTVELEKFIEDFDKVSKRKDQQYVCKTCTNYLKKNKLPPSSVKNGLKLKQTDEFLRENDLMLTELEAALP